MRRYHDVEYNPRERRHLRDRTSVHRARQASLRVTDSEFGPISIGSRRALARFRRRMVSRRVTPGALHSSGAGARKTPRTRSGCGVEGGTVVGAGGSGIDDYMALRVEAGSLSAGRRTAARGPVPGAVAAGRRAGGRGVAVGRALGGRHPGAARDEGEGEKRGLKGTAGHETLTSRRTGRGRHDLDNGDGAGAVPGPRPPPQGTDPQRGGSDGLAERAAVLRSTESRRGRVDCPARPHDRAERSERRQPVPRAEDGAVRRPGPKTPFRAVLAMFNDKRPGRGSTRGVCRHNVRPA